MLRWFGTAKAVPCRCCKAHRVSLQFRFAQAVPAAALKKF